MGIISVKRLEKAMNKSLLHKTVYL